MNRPPFRARGKGVAILYAAETNNLIKSYGKTRGVTGVNLAVRDGEIFGFIGPDGAGKTTTIRLLLGLLKPTSGEAKLFNRKVPPGGGRLYRRVGYVPAEVQFYPEMTGRDMLEYARGFYHSIDDQWVEELVDRLNLDPDRKFKAYSHGNRKKLGLIQALLHKPRLIILDEPGSGLDPLIRQEMFKIFEEMNQKGATIFFSTHEIEEIERVCHRVAMINNGSIIHQCPVDELPGREIRVLEIKLAGREASSEALSRIGTAEKFSSRSGYYRIISRLPVNQLTKELSRFDLEYLKVTDPSLEEIFFSFYQSGAGGGQPFDA